MPTNNAVFRSRADQVLEHLRRKIQAGHWRERLPAERDLATELGVSRWSLRAALAELKREGLIAQRAQAGTRLAARRKKKGRIAVGIVLDSHAQLIGRTLYIIDGLRHHLQARDVQMEVHKVPYLKSSNVSSHFRKLTQEVIHDCWAMNAPTIPMQAWCRNKHLPSMVLGSGDEDIGLPSASTDFQALGHHVAGEILRHGHRRIAVILPRQEKGEDLQTRQGVAAAIASAPYSGLHASLEYHDLTEIGICRLADRLLKQKARPTAWLVCRQGHFLTLFTYLLHRGVKIPQELSIISRDSDIYFDNLIPPPSRYVIDSELMVRQYARLILRVAAGQYRPEQRVRLMPHFVPGQTLGPLPEIEDLH